MKGTPLEVEAALHRPIKVSIWKKFVLFFKLRIKGLKSMLCIKDRQKDTYSKLIKLYETGMERLEKEMSIEKVIKSLRDLKTLMKTKIIDE
jgi:hypothetical protein